MSLYIVILIGLFVVGVSMILGLAIAYICHPVLYWLYKRAAPKDVEETTEVGERIEAVFTIDFWSTTFAWFVSKWLFRFLFFNLFLLLISRNLLSGGRESFGGVLFYYFFMAFIVIQVVVNSTYLPFAMLSKDWEYRIRVKIIATTKAIYTYVLRATLLGVITGDAALPYRSRSDVQRAKEELQWSGDPQDINPRVKTGWIHDQIISLRTSIRRFYGGGVRSAALLSNVEGASDLVFLVLWGSTLVKIIDVCAPIADLIDDRARTVAGLKTSLDVGTPGVHFDKATAKRQKDEIDARARDTQYASTTFNPFEVEDLGIWNQETGECLEPYDESASSLSEVILEGEWAA